MQYDENIHLNETCPIFQTEFSNSDDITELPCKHAFTPNAIRKWLKEENAICPICRYKLAAKEVSFDASHNTLTTPNLLYTALDISINRISRESILDISRNTEPINFDSINMFNRLLYFIDVRERQILEEEELQETIINSMNTH